MDGLHGLKYALFILTGEEEQIQRDPPMILWQVTKLGYLFGNQTYLHIDLVACAKEGGGAILSSHR